MSDPALLQDKVKMFYKRFANALLIAVTEIEHKGNQSKNEFYSTKFSSLLQMLTGIRPWTADFKVDTVKTKLQKILGEEAAGVEAIGDITYAMINTFSFIFNQAEIKVLADAHAKARARTVKFLDLQVPEKNYSTDDSQDLFELSITILNQLPLDAYREILQESRGMLITLYPEQEEKR